jgi:multiple sugar transport system substrate-binding protein
MKRLLAILCAAALIPGIIAGCNDTMPDEATPSPVDSGMNGEPGIEPGEPPFDIPWWTPPVINVETTEIDPDQTGDLVIYLPPISWVGLTPVINFYREIYPNVNVIVEDIGNDYVAYGTRVRTELMAGTGPDIIAPRLMWGADYTKMAGAGAFLDLNEFIEQDDSFNLDDYVMPVLDGGLYRGKRYIMPYAYSVLVLVSIPSKLDEIGFDTSKMGDTLSFIDEVVRTLPKAQENPLFKAMVNCDMWNILFCASGMRYVDFESNTVLPYEETLEKLVNAYKPYHPFDNTHYPGFGFYEELPAHLRTGTVMFGRGDFMLGFFELASRLKTYGDIQMNVIPDMNGDFHAFISTGLAIRAGSPNRQNAWNFIKLMLSPENQSSSHFAHIPVHKDSIIAQVEYIYNGGLVYYDNIRSTKLSAEEVETYISLITNVDYHSSFFSQPAQRMFSEHMEPFFKGDRSYEDSISRLRNDLTLYMSE